MIRWGAFNMSKKTLRSIAAVVAGVLFTVIVTAIADMIVRASGIYGTAERLTDSLALVATSYRVVIGVAGGWVTAQFAPDRPVFHAVLLGIVGTVLGILGVIATWNMDLGPRWYPVLLAALAIPQCWLGGWIRVKGLRGAKA